MTSVTLQKKTYTTSITVLLDIGDFYNIQYTVDKRKIYKA